MTYNDTVLRNLASFYVHTAFLRKLCLVALYESHGIFSYLKIEQSKTNGDKGGHLFFKMS